MWLLPVLILLPHSVLPFSTREDLREETAKEAIQEVIRRYVDARAKADPVATAALFTPDVDQLVSSGEWRAGRAAVVTGTMASSQQNAGTRLITIDQIRFLTPEVALVDGRYTLTPPAGAPPRLMRTSLLLQKANSNWQISAIRNMLPAPPSS
jgi:uncharacterized protein (TIGR02246 family)